jgi:hypothetical protein
MPFFGSVRDSAPFADKRYVFFVVRVLAKGNAYSLEAIHRVRQQ